MADENGLSLIIGMLKPYVYRWLIVRGYIFDTTGARRNVFDIAQDRKRFLQVAQELESAATKADSDALVDGVFKILGVNPKNVPSQEKLQFYKQFWHLIAPYIYYTFGEDAYDSLFGKFGSRAVFLKGILEAYTGFGIDGDLASQLVDRFMEEVRLDPSIAKGFTAKDVGEILRSAIKEGLIAPTVNPNIFVDELKKLLKYYAAARDAVARYGKSASVEDLTKIILETRAKYEGLPLDEAAFRLRRDLYILSAFPHGLYSAALAASGVQAPVSGEVIKKLDEKLRNNLRYSPAANIAGATIRAVREMGAGGPLLRLYHRIMNNDMPRVLPAQWIAMASESGLDPGTAMALLRQNSRNISFITPEVEQSIRKAQYVYDLAPYIDRIMVSYRHPELRKGAIAQLAERFGYPNIGMLDAGQVMFLLHSSEVNDKAADILAYASEVARFQEEVSGQLSGTPLRRVTEGLMRLPVTSTGQIAWHELIPGMLGGIHESKFTPALDKLDALKTKSDLFSDRDFKLIDFDSKLERYTPNKGFSGIPDILGLK